ncbi:hypothetical protein SAMN05216259_11496 [Actinacidiphila guanduensis]|uniref:Uncharacterized protein n=1 Tax=Actinacidiphila guanduensis TaxID=310781 RepID=A0A1H0NKM6_9ACTN|nr:hypothetical protein SAMN05216259_11496 [Actinacidiphila guanduensis]
MILAVTPSTRGFTHPSDQPTASQGTLTKAHSGALGHLAAVWFARWVVISNRASAAYSTSPVSGYRSDGQRGHGREGEPVRSPSSRADIAPPESSAKRTRFGLRPNGPRRSASSVTCGCSPTGPAGVHRFRGDPTASPARSATDATAAPAAALRAPTGGPAAAPCTHNRGATRPTSQSVPLAPSPPHRAHTTAGQGTPPRTRRAPAPPASATPGTAPPRTHDHAAPRPTPQGPPGQHKAHPPHPPRPRRAPLPQPPQLHHAKDKEPPCPAQALTCPQHPRLTRRSCRSGNVVIAGTPHPLRRRCRPRTPSVLPGHTRAHDSRRQSR